jgi:hypothetical protein
MYRGNVHHIELYAGSSSPALYVFETSIRSLLAINPAGEPWPNVLLGLEKEKGASHE